MGRAARRVVDVTTNVMLVLALGLVAALTPATAQDDADTLALDDPAAVEAILEALVDEIEQTDAMLEGLEQARQQGYPAFVLSSGRVIELRPAEATLIVAMSRSGGDLPADPALQFRLAEAFAAARDRGRDLDTGPWVDDVTKEELDAYWQRLGEIYGTTEDRLRDQRERLVGMLDELGTLAEDVEASARSDDGDGLGGAREVASAEGPYRDSCVFRTGYFLDRSRFPETQVVAWRLDDFEPSRARFEFAAATPDEEADDPSHRIERMRQNVAAIEEATVVFDGGFAGFCAWAASTCPDASPKFGGDPVCEDGRPVTD